MGIVIRQSIRNTVITYIGFGIGAINALILYPHFLGKELYGLTGFVLSTANVIMPVMAFGVHNTLVKYFVQYKTEQEKNGFLTYVVLLPLVLIIPFFLAVYIFYDPIALYFSSKNPGVYTYFWQIPIIGFCMGYFEIFYAWAKVHMESVFGNFVRELLLRMMISLGLIGVFLKWYDASFFINLTLLFYLIAAIVMMIYAFKVRPFKMDVKFPVNHREVFRYSIFIILSGSIANVLLDLDKTMLVKFVDAQYIAFYGVAIFIATVISVPARAMQQITYPITARLMAEGKHDELNDLYKKSSITLQVLGGLIFAGIVVNINQLYLMMPPEYSVGLFSVFIIGFSKYIDLILGNNNAIIFNSHYYRAVLLLGVLLTVIMFGLNLWLIPIMGIDGAAIATLISIGLYLLAKLLFVVLKMNLYPFTIRTLYSVVILAVTILGFYFWEFPFHPILNICCKAVLVTLFFMGTHYLLNVSTEVNNMLNMALSVLKKPKP